MLNQWQPWQLQISMAANMATCLTCLVVAASLLVLWWVQRRGLPYSGLMPVVAVWVGLCGVTRLFDVYSMWHGIGPLWAMTIADVARSLFGIVLALSVPFAVKELMKFSPPLHAQHTIREMACLLSEREGDGSATGSPARTPGVLDGNVRARERGGQPILRVCRPGDSKTA